MKACDGSIKGIIVPFQLHSVRPYITLCPPSTHSVHPSGGSNLGSTHVVQLVDLSYSGPAVQVTHVMSG